MCAIDFVGRPPAVVEKAPCGAQTSVSEVLDGANVSRLLACDGMEAFAQFE